MWSNIVSGNEMKSTWLPTLGLLLVGNAMMGSKRFPTVCKDASRQHCVMDGKVLIKNANEACLKVLRSDCQQFSISEGQKETWTALLWTRRHTKCRWSRGMLYMVLAAGSLKKVFLARLTYQREVRPDNQDHMPAEGLCYWAETYQIHVSCHTQTSVSKFKRNTGVASLKNIKTSDVIVHIQVLSRSFHHDFSSKHRRVTACLVGKRSETWGDC